MSVINFSGLASGIDTNALIDAMSKASRAQKVDPLTKEVTNLTDTDTTLETLKDKFSALKDSIYNFSTISGGGLSKTATSTNEAYVGATAANSAVNGSYSVTVSQLARNGTVSFGHSFATTTDTLTAGSISIDVGTGSDKKTITYTSTGTQTAADFVASFNEQSAANGNCATASIVNVGTSGSPDYRVMISSNNSGTTKGTLAITSSITELDPLDVATATTAAQNASFSINGVSIIRENNAVSDVITGITFNLQGAGSATVTVADDITATATKIQDWVDKYNDIITFVTENNQIIRDDSGSEVKNVFKPLADTSIDDNAVQSFRDALASIHSEISGTAVNIMADLGITTQRDGTLKFDKTQFETAMAASPSSVNSVLQQFADTVSTTGGTIDQYIRYQGSFDLTINSNKTLIDDMNTRISEAEKYIAQQEESMRARFARLESLMSKLQSQQQSLTSALSGLGR